MNHVKLRRLLLQHDSVSYAGVLPMDEIATKIFSAQAEKPFVHSTPTRDSKLVEPRVKNFAHLGPHEQLLVTKLLHANNTTVHLTGGIGVGKSRFLRFFEEEILRTLEHENPARTEHCPMVVYVDCDSFAATAASSSKDPEEVIRVFSPFLFDAICARLCGRYDLEEEVGTIWDTLIERNRQSRTTNPAISKLENILRDHSVLKQSEKITATEMLKKRIELRDRIVEQPTLRGFYVAALLNYVADRYYTGHPECMMIIVDNVDPYGSVVQYCVKKVLHPLFSLSRVRVVIALRHTTERQIFGVTHASYTVDSIDYRGAGPMQVIRSRIADAIESSDKTLASVAEAPRTRINQFLRHLLATLHKERSHVSLLLQHLSGASVRKGLVYAQSLLSNSIYDPSGKQSVTEGDVMRAIMVGTKRCYQDGDGQMTCNLFQVLNDQGGVSFLKLRALRAVHVRGEMPLGELVEYLQLFGYSEKMIVDGLNELISCIKRLLWSDAVQSFESIGDLITHADTHLIISDAGRAYQSYLYHRIEYIQEIMLDTLVPESMLGKGWNFNQIEDRFRLVAAFLEHITDVEIRELEGLVLPSEALERLSGSEPLFSERMCREISETARRILESAARSGGEFAHGLAKEIEQKLSATIERASERRENEFPSVQYSRM